VACQEYKAVKDAVLFAIDVSSSMLQPPSVKKNDDRDSATMAALKCAYRLMQQRIISNPTDMMGVLLFGTEQTRMGEDDDGNASMPFPHCYVLTQLDVPAAADVKCLRDLVQDEQEAAKLLVPSKEPVSMSNVLFCANYIFTTKAANFASRRLFLVTDNDSPHGSDGTLRSAAAVRAKDLYDLGVLIELFPIAQPGRDFDRQKFYDVGSLEPRWHFAYRRIFRILCIVVCHSIQMLQRQYQRLRKLLLLAMAFPCFSL
jgi:ATP-dependent DNA helicase 2 subunit 1